MHQYKGKIILHTGSMFSGKTSSLWRDMNRFEIAGYRTVIFKPALDTRDRPNVISSHDNIKIEACSICSIEEMIRIVEERSPEVIGIDELQFLKGNIEKILLTFQNWLLSGKTIVCAGLDMDYLGNPFDIVKDIMSYADYVEKHHAVCAKCGSDAWVSHRTTGEGERVVIGASEKYEPLCRSCYFKEKKYE